MSIARTRVAQAGCLVAMAALLLPWHTNAGLGGNLTVHGYSIAQGRVMLIVCVATIALAQTGWRPAWIGAGFAGAIAARELFDPSGIGNPSAGIGLWIAVLACVVAAVALVWNLFAGAEAGGDAEGRVPGQGLSGPLGRRRR